MMQDICFGSSIIEIWVKEDNETKKIVFTGDIETMIFLFFLVQL